MNTEPSRPNFQPTSLPDFDTQFGYSMYRFHRERWGSELAVDPQVALDWAHGQFVGFAHNVNGYYGTQQPVEEFPPTLTLDYDTATNPAQAMRDGTFAQHSGTVVVRRFADGARESVSTFDDGTVRTMIELPDTATSLDGRRIVLTTNQTPGQVDNYEMRFLSLPSRYTSHRRRADDELRSGTTSYRWSEGDTTDIVAEGQGILRPGAQTIHDLVVRRSRRKKEDITWTLPGYIYRQWQRRPEAIVRRHGLGRRVRAAIAAGSSVIDRHIDRRYGSGSNF